MDLQAELKWIHEEIDKVNDPTLVRAIKAILMQRHKVPGNDVLRETLETYNKEIDRANAEIDKGEYLTHEQVKNLTKEW
ncbi:hypothetical protein [Sediminicola luteus]|uniref:Uncharacterized protein n=1 Tax=Sediminicola luteus TaxID=319238 RepID=A0A2A4G5Z7_9FLAO|nr:hypothetical protein [Sediminicola luteus]PCE63162.1 hypothetical protein B7P33_13090 [Sediminicola luteus]